MIVTQRLDVRPWADSDRAGFAEMGRDPAVMLHLGPLQTTAQSNAAIDRMIALQATRGFCFWAVEHRDDGTFLGFCGLKPMTDGIAGLADTTEIGWRLRRDAWGRGFARESAQAVLDWGWRNLPDDRIAAITTPDNIRSWGLMERLGMTRRHDLDFLHPALAADDRLAPHIAYEICRS